MTVAWYVHHHGGGHRARLLATAAHLPEPPIVLSSLPCPAGFDGEWVPLPLDLCPRGADADANGTLHWVPLRHGGLRERMATIAATLRRTRADVLVADVSVEVALLARLHGVPTVVMGQRGVREDPAHTLAYAQAAAVALPWTAASDPGPAGDRRVHVGAISRFDAAAPFDPVPAGGDVLLVVGAGGHDLDPDWLFAAAESTPGRTWHVAGDLRVEGGNVVDHGSAADVEALLRRCSVVVGTAGANVIAEVAAARRPFVCLPQDRPFDEQAHNGAALRRLGAAEVLDAFPPAAHWPALLAAAEARDPAAWSALHDGRGAERLAELVADIAEPLPALPPTPRRTAVPRSTDRPIAVVGDGRFTQDPLADAPPVIAADG